MVCSLVTKPPPTQILKDAREAGRSPRGPPWCCANINCIINNIMSIPITLLWFKGFPSISNGSPKTGFKPRHKKCQFIRKLIDAPVRQPESAQQVCLGRAPLLKDGLLL